MNDISDSDATLLRKVARQTLISTWVSCCCLAVLVLVLLFPRQAAWISECSVEFQEWISPLMGGVLGAILAIGIIVPAAAYVLSRISPPAPREVEDPKKH